MSPCIDRSLTDSCVWFLLNGIQLAGSSRLPHGTHPALGFSSTHNIMMFDIPEYQRQTILDFLPFVVTRTFNVPIVCFVYFILAKSQQRNRE